MKMAASIMISRSSIQLLRFPFSLYLAPVYLFAFSQSDTIRWEPAILSFFILHFLVYPSSNGYNCFMDRDTSSIGGLEKPPPPSIDLLYITWFMDIAAVLLSLLIHPQVATLTALYILASRAYSDRKVRLKKYSLAGFLVVAVFQGGIAFLISYLSVNGLTIGEGLTTRVALCMLASSLLIGASYPLTQIYQHEPDLAHGDTTLSYKLGLKGTFIFSAILFLSGLATLFFYFRMSGRIWQFSLLSAFVVPVMAYLGLWFYRVVKNPQQANFRNTMTMNAVSAASLSACFLTITIFNFLNP